VRQTDVAHFAERSRNVERKREQRYSNRFRKQAVERMSACDNTVGKLGEVQLASSKTEFLEGPLLDTELSCCDALVAAHPELLSALKDDEMVPVKPRLYFPDAPDVHDCRSVDS